MKILVVGDGKVGYTLAQLLSNENYDVTVIDNNTEALNRALETLDVLCLKGNASSHNTLKEAGAGSSDIVIAVTSRDEVNMICALFAHKLGAKKVIARIRNPEYIDSSEMLMKDLGIDMLINPELICAAEIWRLLRFPYARSIESFANRQMELVEFKVEKDSMIAGKKVEDLAKAINLPFLFGAVVRDKEVTIPHGSFVINEDDSVFVMGEPNILHQFFKYLGYSRGKAKNVMIVGGSKIAYYLVKFLSRNIGYTGVCKVIEQNIDICNELSESLPEAMIIHGDGSDSELLKAESIHEMDACVSLMDIDEKNIICALDAANMGAKKVICKVTRNNYERVYASMDIGSMVNPKELAAKRIARYVHSLHSTRDSFIESIITIADGAAVIIEFSVNGPSRLVGTKLKDLVFKNNVLVGAIIHNKKLIIPNGDSIINKGDTVIVVAKDIEFRDINDILDGGII